MKVDRPTVAPSRARGATSATSADAELRVASRDQKKPRDRATRPPSSRMIISGETFAAVRLPRRPGVWEAPDAPDGYVALVVNSTLGRRMLRIEIASDFYSHAWITWLERWRARWDRLLAVLK